MVVACPHPPVTDSTLVAPFISSVKRVLETMLSLKCEVGAPHLRSGTTANEYDYSGIISLSGQVVGVVVASFHKTPAIELVNTFAGGPLEPDTADFSDALGELTNMIVGGAKTDLGVEASISVPTVIMGRGHVVARPRDVPCVVVPCSTSLGNFAIEISLKPVRG